MSVCPNQKGDIALFPGVDALLASVSEVGVEIILVVIDPWPSS